MKQAPELRSSSFALIVGARPNLMKIAPLMRVLDAYDGVTTTLIHTGQHYDRNLSDVFFDELRIRVPDVSLGVGSGPHGQQTARILEQLERVFQGGDRNGRPLDRVVVVGDVNSTLAAALAAAKLNIPVAHVEAGLRSFDRTMPEEINRIVTDSISDLLLVSDPAGVANLQREGHGDSQIHLVGNIMIDTLRASVDEAQRSDVLSRFQQQPGGYAFLTLHRPSNVDTADVLGGLVDTICTLSARLPFVFPIHPRTRARLESFNLMDRLRNCAGVHCTEPLGYLDCVALSSQAKVVVTDSGGLQEESTALEVPCLTLRKNTERPITVEEGTSTLIGSDTDQLRTHLESVLSGNYKTGRCPKLWDGRAAQRIADVLVQV